jgi:hypothetical protein
MKMLDICRAIELAWRTETAAPSKNTKSITDKIKSEIVAADRAAKISGADEHSLDPPGGSWTPSQSRSTRPAATARRRSVFLCGCSNACATDGVRRRTSSPLRAMPSDGPSAARLMRSSISSSDIEVGPPIHASLVIGTALAVAPQNDWALLAGNSRIALGPALAHLRQFDRVEVMRSAAIWLQAQQS